MYITLSSRDQEIFSLCDTCRAERAAPTTDNHLINEEWAADKLNPTNFLSRGYVFNENDRFSMTSILISQLPIGLEKKLSF